MMTHTNRFQYLLTKYLDKHLSPDESGEFYGYVASGDFEDVLDDRIGKALAEKGAEQSKKLSDEASDHILQQIMGSEEQASVVPIKKRRLV